jgi:CRISPR-associated endonuclease/helicase Cas3
MPPPYAHSKAGIPPGEGWHALADHLRSVAELARGFASVWGAAEWAFIAGLWHDLGKAAPDWQAFLADAGAEAHVLGEEQPRPAGRRRGPDHSSAGAIHARERFGSMSLPIQFAIAGHHAGLADWEDLKTRLLDREPRYRQMLAGIDPASLADVGVPTYPPWLTSVATPQAQRRRLETFVRMVFSALVDADFLDTERFYSGDLIDRCVWPTLDAYLRVLDAYLAQLQRSAAPTAVNTHRRRVLEWCRRAAESTPGAHTLTVPTGGGKTLSSLAFALCHARRHGLQRVVIALPFISILDQTASVLRDIFELALGADVLVEHHSAIEPVHDTAANRLAAENWDAPLVVTTQVQLFESLFANRPSACRKLHNLARSVIVLDEVQTLPAALLAPILDVLQELRAHYGSTLLLTTATQPALHSRHLGPWRFEGLDPRPREIVPAEEMDGLFAAFRRVEIRWPGVTQPIAWPALADRLADHRQVLAIVHKRQDAADLWQALADRAASDVRHLSALMCPEHRRKVLAEIRQQLALGQDCRVVSTQLVEAGVDVDFPVVYRAMAGLEALAQSAGRCNREGRLPSGRFEVFRAPSEPPGLLRQHKEEAELMLAEDPDLDLTSPRTFVRYFDRIYASRRTDARGIQALRQTLRFEETAVRFRMIDSAGEPVFVPYGERGARAIAAFRYAGPSRAHFRALQPFAVNVYPQQLRELVAAGAVELLHDSIYVLRDQSLYDIRLGLRASREPGGEDWIV